MVMSYLGELFGRGLFNGFGLGEGGDFHNKC